MRNVGGVFISLPQVSDAWPVRRRPTVTFPAAGHNCPLIGTKLYYFVSAAHVCEQLAYGCYLNAQNGRDSNARHFESQVQRSNHYALTPQLPVSRIQTQLTCNTLQGTIPVFDYLRSHLLITPAVITSGANNNNCVSDAFSGGAGDWARAVAGINYSFEMELRDRGQLGFVLPTSYIQPVSEEAWSAIRVLATEIIPDRKYSVATVTTTAGDTASTNDTTRAVASVNTNSSGISNRQNIIGLISVCAVILLIFLISFIQAYFFITSTR